MKKPFLFFIIILGMLLSFTCANAEYSYTEFVTAVTSRYGNDVDSLWGKPISEFSLSLVPGDFSCSLVANNPRSTVPGEKHISCRSDMKKYCGTYRIYFYYLRDTLQAVEFTATDDEIRRGVDRGDIADFDMMVTGILERNNKIADESDFEVNPFLEKNTEVVNRALVGTNSHFYFGVDMPNAVTTDFQYRWQLSSELFMSSRRTIIDG